jgi:hypothetical protein
VPRGVDHVVVVSSPARSAARFHGRARRVRVAKRPRCEEIAWSQKSGGPTSLFSQSGGLVYGRGLRERCAKGDVQQKGSVQMIRFVIDTVLFSCMGAIVTGVVIAAATLLG